MSKDVWGIPSWQERSAEQLPRALCARHLRRAGTAAGYGAGSDTFNLVHLGSYIYSSAVQRLHKVRYAQRAFSILFHICIRSLDAGSVCDIYAPIPRQSSHPRINHTSHKICLLTPIGRACYKSYTPRE